MVTHRAWLLDLDGTLYHATPVKLCMAAELVTAGPRVARIIAAFRHEHEAVRRSAITPGMSPFEEQIRRTAEHLAVRSDLVAGTVEEWMHRRPARWLRAFRRRALLARAEEHRARGGKLAVVSDYPARTKLAALDLCNRLDVIVANGEEGGPMRLKPHPEGYLAAAERLGVAPRDCLVIGDRDDADGEAARRAGMAFERV